MFIDIVDTSCKGVKRLLVWSETHVVWWTIYDQWPLLLTWFNFNPDMDK